jgi:Spy/CpxP family protein refolding chaperone
MVSFAFAQDNSQDQQEGKHHGRHGAMAGRGMGDPDQHLKMLTKQLNLTADQQAKIKPILEEQHSKMQQWMQSNQNASQEDRRAQMKQWHDETTSRVREVLTPDQQKKFDQMQQNMMEHHHGGHGNHDHGDHQGPSSM